MKDAGCHKASGLKRLAERWGIMPEQSVAFSFFLLYHKYCDMIIENMFDIRSLTVLFLDENRNLV